MSSAWVDENGVTRLRGTLGGGGIVKHVVNPVTFADISTVTGFADVYLLPENETVLVSWPVVTQAFNGTADGHAFSGVQLSGPNGVNSGGATVGDSFTATVTNATNAIDGLIGPDPSGGGFANPMIPIEAPTPGGGSVQLVLDFTGGNVAPYVQGTTGTLEYHLLIAVA